MSAVVPIVVIGGLGVALFIFKDKIADFFSLGLASAGKDLDQFGKDVNTNIGKIGKDFDQFGKEQQANFNQFVSDTQKGIDASLAGTEANINNFFSDAQKNFDANITGIETGINNQKKAIDQFGKDAQQNIATSVSGIQQGFTDFGEGVSQFFSNPFGGQNKPKEITKEVNAMTLNKTGQDVSRSRRTGFGGFATDAGQHTSKPDILIQKDRPLSIGAIKPAVQTVTQPTVSKFLVSNPSLSSETNVEVKQVEEKTRATRFSR